MTWEWKQEVSPPATYLMGTGRELYGHGRIDPKFTPTSRHGPLRRAEQFQDSMTLFRSQKVKKGTCPPNCYTISWRVGRLPFGDAGRRTSKLCSYRSWPLNWPPKFGAPICFLNLLSTDECGAEIGPVSESLPLKWKAGREMDQKYWKILFGVLGLSPLGTSLRGLWRSPVSNLGPLGPF